MSPPTRLHTQPFRRLWRHDVLAAAVVLGAAVAGVGCVAAGGASLPVLEVSPTGADANPCTKAAPCASFDRAYRAARPGNVVEVAGGTYGDQRVGFDPSKTSAADVVFRPAAGASVVVGSKPLGERLHTTAGIEASHAKHVTFRNMTIRGDVVADDGAEDVTFLNLASDNGVPGVYAPTRGVTFRGGRYGNTLRYFAQVYPSANGTHNVSFTIDGPVLHDIRSDDLGSFHVACILVADAIGATIRDLRTYDCDVFDVELGVFSDGRLSNVLVENNALGSTGPTVNASLALNTNTTTWHGLNVRNNSVVYAMRHPDCSGGCTNVRYSGNISPLPGFYPAACVAHVTYRHNVWTGGTKKCDRTDIAVGNPRFVRADGTPPDLHLAAGSPAIGHGDPANAPLRDIDGQLRPHGKPKRHGRRVDAGADQRR